MDTLEMAVAALKISVLAACFASSWRFLLTYLPYRNEPLLKEVGFHKALDRALKTWLFTYTGAMVGIGIVIAIIKIFE